MNSRHRSPVARLGLALLGAVIAVAPFAFPMDTADAQAPEPACNALLTVADELDNAGDQLNFGELNNLATTIREDIHPALCSDAGGTTTTTTTTPPSTTTTTQPASEPLVTTPDGRITEVGRVKFDPPDDVLSDIAVDPQLRRGYRIYGGGGGFAPVRIHAFHLDTLADGPSRTYPGVEAIYNNPFPHTSGIISAVGGGNLYWVDSNERVVVVDGKTLDLVDSFAPPLLRSGDPAVSSNDVGDNIDSLLSGRQFSGVEVSLNGLAYLEPHGELTEPKLLVLTETPIGADTPGSIPSMLTLEQWDAETGRTEWSTRLSGCTSRVIRHPIKYGLGIAVSESPSGQLEALIGCSGSNKRGEVWKVELLGNGTGIGAQTHVASVPNATAFLPDAAGRRMIVMTTDNKGQFFIGVDVDREGVYGSVITSRRPEGLKGGVASGGLDPATGRAYGFAKEGVDPDTDAGGLLIIDARRRPMPQGLQFPELNPDRTNDGGHQRIRIDPGTSGRATRIFVPHVRALKTDMIRVFADGVPVEGEVPLDDIDRFTKDVPEEEDKTRAAFNGSTSAYGLRVLLTGGLYSLTTNEDAVRNIMQNPEGGLFPGCEPPDRELVLAEITPRGTNLSAGGTNAAAVSATVDERTRQDLDRPVASCWPTQGIFSRFDQTVAGLRNQYRNSAAYPTVNQVWEIIKDQPVGLPDSDPSDDDATVGNLLGNEPPEDRVPNWPTQPDPLADQLINNTIRDPFPFYPAVCSLAGESAQRPLPEGHKDHGEDDLALQVLGIERNLGPVPGFTAEVNCAEDGQRLEARAYAANTLVGVTGTLTFDGTEVTTVIERRPDGGLVATTEAKVKGVSIANALRVGEVRSLVVVEAGGRPGTAKASLTREWCGVVGLGSSTRACQDVNDPEFQANLRAFNTNVLSRLSLELRVPPPDPELRQGTPGGALAAMQKDRFLVVGEKLLNNDARTELPAMELIEVKDSGHGRARHIYQFAGVNASTAYNISQIPSFNFDFVLPTFDGLRTTAAPPAASAVAAANALREASVVPASSSGGIPGLGGGLLEALTSGLKWLLRNPWEVLKFMMILFTAWALPLHLHEKRRALGLVTKRGD